MLFVSYSRSDRTELADLLPKLRASSAKVWVDQEQIPMGEAFVEHIWTGLTSSSFYLLLDTPAAQQSYWVKQELEAASALRQSGHLRLLARLSATNVSNYLGCNFDLELVATDDWENQLRETLITLLDSPSPATAAPQRTPLLGRADLGQPKYWTGRQQELGRLDDWWASQSRGLWIQGVGGIGKTGLLQTWVTAMRTLGAHKNTCDGVYYLRGAEIQATTELEDRHPCKLPRKLLAIDGIDESRNVARGEFLLSQWVLGGGRAITVSRALPDHPNLRNFTRIDLAPFNSASTSTLLEGIHLSPEEANELLQMSGGHPLVLTQLRALVRSRRYSGAELIKKLRRMAGDA